MILANLANAVYAIQPHYHYVMLVQSYAKLGLYQIQVRRERQEEPRARRYPPYFRLCPEILKTRHH